MITDLRDGEVLALRTCATNGAAHGGFLWPLVVGAEVTAPDWSSTATCGYGLHGLLRGVGDGSLLDWSADAKWLVVAVAASECVDLGGKVKFPRCRIVHVGDRFTASALLREHYPDAAITAGTAMAGYGGTATAGYLGTATAGNRGIATAGYGGTATAGDLGTVIVKLWDDEATRYRLIVGYVGEGGIEANVAYRVEGGKLVRAEVTK